MHRCMLLVIGRDKHQIAYYLQPKIWPHHGKNKRSSGELWLEMIRYYTEEFDWMQNVITVRTLEPISKIHKLWNTKCLAIEDPFELSHNLGAGLSRNSELLEILGGKLPRSGTAGNSPSGERSADPGPVVRFR